MLSNRFRVTIVNGPIAGMSPEFSIIPVYAISGPEPANKHFEFFIHGQVELGMYTRCLRRAR